MKLNWLIALGYVMWWTGSGYVGHMNVTGWRFAVLATLLVGGGFCLGRGMR